MRGAFAKGRLGLGEVQDVLIDWTSDRSAMEPAEAFLPHWEKFEIVNAILISQGRLKLFTDTTEPTQGQPGFLYLSLKWHMSGLESHLTPLFGHYLAETTHVVQASLDFCRV